MRRRTLATLAVALAVAAGGVAGCGGDSESDATTEATTTEATTTAATTAGTTTGTTTAAPSGGGLTAADHLPPPTAIGGVNDGTPRTLATATEFVDVLYQQGDPAKAGAVERLEEAGYETGILRDQVGRNPESGIALLRTYAIRLRDADAARDEVEDAVEEVRNASAARTEDVETDIPDAEALRVDVDQGNIQGSVFFVTWPVGSEVYGIQAVSTTGGGINQEEILGAARDLATKADATP